MKLEEYKAKRDFRKSPEPRPRPVKRERPLTFVIQKHSARRLHYDLRLELDGVMKSWAVPRGPTLDPAIRRLAVMVEDHPLEYQEFEGVIPEGSYGAGAVIIWDRGSYHHPAAEDREGTERLMREGLKKGHITFILEGSKLRGEFALVKTKFSEKSWLLLKARDSAATRNDVLKSNRSVASHKTLEGVFAAGPKRASGEAGVEQIRLREAIEKEGVKDLPKVPMPRGVSPMLATLVKKPFDDKDWLFEVKWDGYRAIAEVRHGQVSFYSRNSINLERRFPEIVESLQKLEFEAILDGEVVVVDDQGRPDFELLQSYSKTRSGHLLYYVFDILHLNKHDLTDMPLIKRKELLKRILPKDPRLRLSGFVQKGGKAFFRAAAKQGLEGIMAKRAQSTYHAGQRSREWLKVKTLLTRDAVIAGFSAPRGSREKFGSLVLGAYRGRELVHIGNVGAGFNVRSLAEVHSRLSRIARKTSPFKTGHASGEMVSWVKPSLVCEVAFHGWTRAGVMRQPVFLRMRPDKSAREVTRNGDEAYPPPKAGALMTESLRTSTI
jgi:bifunctional non-homologous end joining protein LigD